MSLLTKQHIPYFLIILFLFGASTFTSLAKAADFTISNGETETNAQTLTDNETGIVESGGTLDVAETAVDISGTSTLLNNSGTIIGTGLFVNGVSLSGSTNSIVNSGDISGTFYGLKMIGSGNNITNSGTIYSAGNVALYDSGSGSTINNSGFLESITGQGLYLTGSDTTVNNSGTIYSQGISLLESGDDITINNSGTIESLDSYGLFSAGVNLTINNNGFIKSTNEIGLFMEDAATDITINNSGTIESVYAYGLFGTGLNLTINNSGYIKSTDDIGLFDNGNYTTINNSGTISSNNLHGLYSAGINLTVSNSGDITSLVRWGLYAGGTNSTVSNSGTIYGFDSGVWMYGDYATLNNSGTIEGEDSYGVSLDKDYATLNNSGTIESTYGYAVYTQGVDSVINNSGSISTMSGEGLSIWGINTTINNSGAINSSWHGVAAHVSDATINNSGTIVGGLIGINILGANNTVNNNGVISGSTESILGDNNDTTVNLLRGSQIIGAIDLGTGTDVVNISENFSSVLDITNAQVNFVRGGAGVVNGSTVYTHDTSSDSHKAANLGSTTNAIHGVLTSRLTHKEPQRLARVAALELAPGMLYREEPARAWGEVFTLNRTRDKDGQTLAFEQKVSGFTGGYEFDNKGYRIGFMGGFAGSSSETDKIKSLKTDTDTIFIGAYGRFHLGKVNLTGSLTLGSEQHENFRHVLDAIEGMEIAKSDYDSFFISPSITLDSAYKIGDKMELRPSIALSYTTADFDSYKETGTTNANLTIKGHSLNATNSQVQIALAHITDKGELELRAGAKTRQTDSDKITASLAGASFQYSVSGDDNVSGGYGGIYARYGVSENTNLTADVEVTNLSGGEEQVFGKVGLQVSF